MNSEIAMHITALRKSRGTFTFKLISFLAPNAFDHQTTNYCFDLTCIDDGKRISYFAPAPNPFSSIGDRANIFLATCRLSSFVK